MEIFVAILAIVVAVVIGGQVSWQLAVLIALALTPLAFADLIGKGKNWRTLFCRLVEPKGRRRGPVPLESLYRQTMTGFLDRLDERLNPESGAAETSLRRAWGWRLYDRCLLLSLVYPLIFIVVQWGLSVPPDAGMIGTLAVLPGSALPPTRNLTLCAVSLLILYILRRQRVMAKLQSAYRSFGVESKRATDVAEFTYFSIAMTFAFTGVVFFAGLFAGAVAGTIAGTIAFAGNYGSLLAYTGFIAVTFAGAGAISSTFTNTFTIAIFGAIGITTAFEKIHARQPEIAYGMLIAILLFAYVGTLHYGSLDNDNAPTLILFYGLLPLVNAQFDFLSMTATRFLLRQGLKPGANKLGWGLADLGVGGVCFLGLCYTAVAVAAGANRVSGETLIDLPAIFADPGAHVWLFAAFLTTLLPTFLHLSVVVFSFVFAWPERVRHWCAGKLIAHHLRGTDESDAKLARLTVATMAGLCLAACAVLIWLIWVLFGWYGYPLGDALIRAMEGWHCWLTGVALAACGGSPAG